MSTGQMVGLFMAMVVVALLAEMVAAQVGSAMVAMPGLLEMARMLAMAGLVVYCWATAGMVAPALSALPDPMAVMVLLLVAQVQMAQVEELAAMVVAEGLVVLSSAAAAQAAQVALAE